MLSFLLGLLGIIPKAFSTIDNITNAISNERITAIKAKTDEEKVAAEERAKALEARRDVMLSESKSPWNGLMRFLIALGPMVILNKIFIWDKTIGSLQGCAGQYAQAIEGCKIYRTDLLDPNLWWVLTAVVGFYFLAEATRAFKK
jgi:hypothetical protein